MSIDLLNISKKYGDVQVFDNLSLSLKKGEISCVLGHSGSGKTTLLNILGGITDFDGKINNISGNISYIFQEDRLIESLTVYQNIEYVLLRLIKDKSQRDSIISGILTKAEIADKKNNYPSELSGGMRQRLSMARAFVYPSDILLMDEPFRSLDTALKSRMIKVFLNLWEKDKRTCLYVTHDIDEALLISDTIYILQNKPATVGKTIRIDITHNERDITNSYFNNIRNDIYNILTK